MMLGEVTRLSPPLVPVLVYAPLLAGAVAWNLSIGLRPWEWPAHLAAGLFLWTLIEYLMHRWIFHGSVLPVKTRDGLHLAHHVAPTAPEKIVAKPWFSLSIATGIWAILFAVLRSAPLASLTMTGVILGYLSYEFVHYGVHTRPGEVGGLRWWRRNHFYHHFQEPARAFGVTSPIWDFVFRTTKALPVPPAIAGERGELPGDSYTAHGRKPLV